MLLELAFKTSLIQPGISESSGHDQVMSDPFTPNFEKRIVHFIPQLPPDL